MKNILINLFHKRSRSNIKRLKWGIIGTGNMAETFTRAIEKSPNSIVYAVASRNQEKANVFAKRHSIKYSFGSYEALINKHDIDIIYIATPVFCHYENVLLCLKAGRNVLCEKPMVLDSKQLIELHDLAKLKGCFLMEAMWMRCLPTFNKADEWINSDRIGNINLIRANFYKMEKIDPTRSIFKATEGGGVIRDFGVYAIAFMVKYLEGPPNITHVTKRIQNGLDTDWSVIAYYNGKKAIINLSSNFLSESKAAIVGDKGSIIWGSQFNRTNEVSLYDEKGNIVESCRFRYTCQGFEYEVLEVEKCLQNGLKESFFVPLESSLKCATVIEQLLDS